MLEVLDLHNLVRRFILTHRREGQHTGLNEIRVGRCTQSGNKHVFLNSPREILFVINLRPRDSHALVQIIKKSKAFYRNRLDLFIS
jgi:hypothetical protein